MRDSSAAKSYERFHCLKTQSLDEDEDFISQSFQDYPRNQDFEADFP